MNTLTRWTILLLVLLLAVTPLHAEDEMTPQELEQAVQVVRRWLNMPEAPVHYFVSDTGSNELTGPRRHILFEAPGGIVTVDLLSMTVVAWSYHWLHWAKDARTDLPEKSENEIRAIAWGYAQQHFPPLAEFPNWDVCVERHMMEDLFFHTGKRAALYQVDFNPSVFNTAGQKIPVLTTGCSVHVDPYTGNVVGFSFRHIPLTFTQFDPALSPEQAKAAVEEAFRQLGATDACAVMRSEEDAVFVWAEDGLVIGANDTSGLRLAYLFDYVVTYAAGDLANQFGSLDAPYLWRAGIDANTGELLYRDLYLGAATEKQRALLLARARQKREHAPKASLRVLPGANIVVNGMSIRLKYPPLLRGGRVYLWTGYLKELGISKGSFRAMLAGGLYSAKVIKDAGKQYVALRDVCQAVGIRIHWDNRRKISILYADWLDVKKLLQR
ncbi:MAG: hypothetical protein ACP5RN_07465 [Armatimonadota bacterium]